MFGCFAYCLADALKSFDAFVLYIIWMALLLYHVVNEAGAIAVIGRALPGLAEDRPAQALLLGWVFGSFLQGASGFGVGYDVATCDLRWGVGAWTQLQPASCRSRLLRNWRSEAFPASARAR